MFGGGFSIENLLETRTSHSGLPLPLSLPFFILPPSTGLLVQLWTL